MDYATEQDKEVAEFLEQKRHEFNYSEFDDVPFRLADGRGIGFKEELDEEQINSWGEWLILVDTADPTKVLKEVLG